MTNAVRYGYNDECLFDNRVYFLLIARTGGHQER